MRATKNLLFIMIDHKGNNVKLIVNQNDRKMASLYLSVVAGAREETGFPLGIAHLMEHLLVSGTKSLPREELHKKIALMGGSINAFTDYESVAVFMSLPYDHVEEGLKILADIVYHPAFAEEDFKREKGIVLQEIRGGADNIYEQISHKLYKNMFNVDSRISQPIAGSLASVRKITISDIRAYFKKKCKNNRMILVAACNEEKDVTKLAKKYFKVDDKFVAPKKISNLKNFSNNKNIYHMSGVTQDRLHICFEGVPIDHPDKTKFDLLKIILADGFASRIFNAVRSTGNVYDMSSEFVRHMDGNVFLLRAVTSPGNYKEIENIINKEIDKVKKEKVSDEELQTAKNLLTARYYRLLDSQCGDSGLYLEEEYYKVTGYVKEYFDKAMATTIEDVQEAANMMFNQKRRTILIRGK